MLSGICATSQAWQYQQSGYLQRRGVEERVSMVCATQADQRITMVNPCFGGQEALSRCFANVLPTRAPAQLGQRCHTEGRRTFNPTRQGEGSLYGKNGHEAYPWRSCVFPAAGGLRRRGHLRHIDPKNAKTAHRRNGQDALVARRDTHSARSL